MKHVINLEVRNTTKILINIEDITFVSDLPFGIVFAVLRWHLNQCVDLECIIYNVLGNSFYFQKYSYAINHKMHVLELSNCV